MERVVRIQRIKEMVFSSLEFVFIFLPIFLLIYYIVPFHKKNLILFLGSIIFYACGSIDYPEYLIYFLLTMIMNFVLGQAIESYPSKKKALMIFAVLYNIAPLALFKITIDNIVLPVGISFFTFQNLSYVFDVYYGKVETERSFINYGAYISMFPQLIAGPIVTYNEVNEQLKEREISWAKAKAGVKYFILGLGAKVLIANRIGGLWTDIAGIGYESITTPLAWMGIIAYCLQLYFDFWGYSLMAIGMGRMLGFYFPTNFDAPYRSVSMSEFYRRWHMTLGNWFKHYVYIPLGGNRGSKFRTVVNLFVVWVLTALWHGIEWNFMLWGMSIYCLVMIEKFGFGKWLEKHRFMGHVYVLAFVPFMWLTFAVTDFSAYQIYLAKMFPFFGSVGETPFATDYVMYLKIYWPFFLAAFIFLTEASEKLIKKYHETFLMKLFLAGIFGFSVYCMYMGMNDPFLYFRF